MCIRMYYVLCIRVYVQTYCNYCVSEMREAVACLQHSNLTEFSDVEAAYCVIGLVLASCKSTECHLS